jgi:hypothetical protein
LGQFVALGDCQLRDYPIGQAPNIGTFGNGEARRCL